MIELKCPDCGDDMELVTRTTDQKKRYRCVNSPYCWGMHSAHPDGTPIGEPAGRTIRKARIAAHETFDKLWRGVALVLYPSAPPTAIKKLERMHRARCYRWLAFRLGIDEDRSHISRMGKELCDQVVEVCEGITPSDVRTWVKTQQASQTVTGTPNPGVSRCG